MATYIHLLNWTEQGAKNVKETVNRTEKNRQMIEKLGGRLLNIFWTQGGYDVVAITEWPDEGSAVAFSLALASSGNVRSETLRAFSAEEMDSFLKKIP